MDDLLNFCGYLIDNQEGAVVTEEGIRRMLDRFIKSEHNKKGSAILSEPISKAPNNEYTKCARCGKEVAGSEYCKICRLNNGRSIFIR